MSNSFATWWTVAHQLPLSMQFFRQEYWSGFPFPSPGDLPDPRIKPRSPALQADSLLSEPPEPPGKPQLENNKIMNKNSGTYRGKCWEREEYWKEGWRSTEWCRNEIIWKEKLVKGLNFVLDLLIATGFPGGSDGKASACNAGDLALILGSGRSPGGENGNPHQYSCLENSMGRGAWRATVHGVTKSQTMTVWLTLSHLL